MSNHLDLTGITVGQLKPEIRFINFRLSIFLYVCLSILIWSWGDQIQIFFQTLYTNLSIWDFLSDLETFCNELSSIHDFLYANEFLIFQNDLFYCQHLFIFNLIFVNNEIIYLYKLKNIWLPTKKRDPYIIMECNFLCT